MFEFSYDTLSSEQTDQYLKRIGFDRTHTVSRENLDRLILLHQRHVPFENLDLYLHRDTIRLDGESLYDKIVTRKRGGFCFELNGCFVLLLRALGYDAYSCMCRVARGRTEHANLAHRGVVVRLEGKTYICDVGYGGPMATFAVEVSREKQTKNGETFWVESLDEGWYLQRRYTSDGEVENIIAFSLQAFLPKDFEPLCAFMLLNPECSFWKNLIVNRSTEEGYRHIRNDVYTVKDSQGKHEIVYQEEELLAILEKDYDLILS